MIHDMPRLKEAMEQMDAEDPTVAQAAKDRAALAVAREQQAKSWELRAAMSIARLWRDQGKRNEALDLLRSITGSPKVSTRLI
jgi:predicted ATPase